MGTNNNFFVLYPILLKLGDVVVPMCTTTSPSFVSTKLDKTQKKFICAHLTEVLSIKVPLSTGEFGL